MEIEKKQTGQILEMKIRGRLDAYWADHLANAIEESIREGRHHLRLNLAGVDYLSSAGIRVLLKFYKQLSGIQGSFSVTHPSPNAYSILELAGLVSLVVDDGVVAPPPPAAEEPRRIEKPNASYQVFDAAPG